MLQWLDLHNNNLKDLRPHTRVAAGVMRTSLRVRTQMSAEAFTLLFHLLARKAGDMALL